MEAVSNCSCFQAREEKGESLLRLSLSSLFLSFDKEETTMAVTLLRSGGPNEKKKGRGKKREGEVLI